jgi:quinol monooxygenase YgiN
MSVIMTMNVQGDPKELERFASEDPDGMSAIAERAKEHGLIAHRFYGSDDGQIMVIDEWPDAESFQAFFADQRDRIEPMMQAAGVSSEPEVRFWRKLESHDEVGWES